MSANLKDPSPRPARAAVERPPVFVSHGSPMIALEPGAEGLFMQRLGPVLDATFGRPRAIVSVSAHTAARVPVVLGAARHEAIHDFGGFDPRLFRMRYDAAGDPALAADLAARLRTGGQPGEPGSTADSCVSRPAAGAPCDPLPGCCVCCWPGCCLCCCACCCACC